jgi:hypothetical protein
MQSFYAIVLKNNNWIIVGYDMTAKQENNCDDPYILKALGYPKIAASGFESSEAAQNWAKERNVSPLPTFQAA